MSRAARSIGTLVSGCLAASAILAALACTRTEPPAVAVQPGAEYSALRYLDRDLVSLNDRCPISGTPLNTEIEPLYVNGRPIGFC